jgi:hypothetical protein
VRLELAPYARRLDQPVIQPGPVAIGRLKADRILGYGVNGPQTLELYRKRTGVTGSVGLGLRSSLSIQPFEGSRFVRGGRYGISIDFGLEVVEKKSTCGASFKSKFIDLTMKPKLTIASS